MPKSKEYISDSDESQSGSDSEPKSKKSKAAKKPEKKAAKSSKPSEVSFQLSKMRFLSVTEFKGKPLISIREFYEADGELKPGRKGISLSKDQWEKVKEHIDDVDQALKDF